MATAHGEGWAAPSEIPRDPAQLRDVDARRRGGRAVGPGSELGHATIAQTVDSYTHLDGAKHEAGAESLNRYLTP